MSGGRAWISCFGAVTALVGCQADIRLLGPDPADAKSVLIATQSDEGLRVVAQRVPFNGPLDAEAEDREAALIFYDLELESLRLTEGPLATGPTGQPLNGLAQAIGQATTYTFTVSEGAMYSLSEMLPDWAREARVQQPSLSVACPELLVRQTAGPQERFHTGYARLPDGSFVIVTTDLSESAVYHLPVAEGFPEYVLVATLPGNYHGVELFGDKLVLFGRGVSAAGPDDAGVVNVFDANMFTASSTLAAVRLEDVVAHVTGCRCTIDAVHSDDGGIDRLRAVTVAGDVYIRQPDGRWNLEVAGDALTEAPECQQPIPDGFPRHRASGSDSTGFHIGYGFGERDLEQARVLTSVGTTTEVACLQTALLGSEPENTLEITGRVNSKDLVMRFLASQGSERFILERAPPEDGGRWSVGHVFDEFNTVRDAHELEITFGTDQLPGYLWGGEDGFAAFDFLDGTHCDPIIVSDSRISLVLPYGAQRFVGMHEGGARWIEVR